jgi:hypothetical protein
MPFGYLLILGAIIAGAAHIAMRPSQLQSCRMSQNCCREQQALIGLDTMHTLREVASHQQAIKGTLEGIGTGVLQIPL